MAFTVTHELWAIDRRGVYAKLRDKGDHLGFCEIGAVRGWARIEQKTVLLFRTDKAEDVPRPVKRWYVNRFPNKRIEDRIDTYRRIEETAWLNRSVVVQAESEGL